MTDKAAAREGFTPLRRAQAGLGLAALGAILVTFPFGTVLAYFGLLLVLAGTVLSSSFQRKAHGWWWMLIAASLLTLLSPLVARSAESTGGLMAVLGGVLILVTVVYAFPSKEAP